MSLSEESMQKIKASFAAIDANGDGKLSAQELVRASKHLGGKITLKEAKQMIEDVDEDGSGYIELDEYVTLMTQKMGAMEYQRESTLRCFAERDVDSDGFVPLAIIREVLEMMGVTDEDMLSYILAEMEVQDYNKIDYKEFYQMFEAYQEAQASEDYFDS